MVTIKLFLDKRRIKKDGSYSLNFMICHQRKTTTRSTGISMRAEDWDENLNLVKKSHPSYKALNIRLRKDFADLQSQLLLADDQTILSFLNPEKSVVVKEDTPAKVSKLTVYQYAQGLIDELKSINKIGNAWVYQSTVNALKLYYPKDDLYFEQIDYAFLDAYNAFLTKKEIKHNSIYLYVRTIRIFYNKAIKVKLVDKALYPFDDFKLKPEKTRKRAIDKLVIKKIKNLKLVEDTTIWHVRNWFLLSFYLIGISIVDLALLAPDSYKDGRIEYKRRKTGKWYDIKVLPQAATIIELYLNSSKTGYILPVINYKPKDEETLMRIVKGRTKLINKYIKQLGEIIEYEGEITTYTARHSWATIAKKLGYSNEVIAEALGHEYGNAITNVYLDSFDKEVIDKVNKRVCCSIE
ncbi:site-specific integrase [Pedobacter sp. P351]|uniref:site-specific integrase n=1 Tax=Pedobacter superstes TaxID=3133441 RepID=UPI0030A143AA